MDSTADSAGSTGQSVRPFSSKTLWTTIVLALVAVVLISLFVFPNL